jgi:hypothetical protein
VDELMKKAEYHNDGYYVITGEKEYWCPNMRGAFETQDMFGGEVLTAEGRNRKWTQQQEKKSKTE